MYGSMGWEIELPTSNAQLPKSNPEILRVLRDFVVISLVVYAKNR